MILTLKLVPAVCVPMLLPLVFLTRKWSSAAGATVKLFEVPFLASPVAVIVAFGPAWVSVTG